MKKVLSCICFCLILVCLVVKVDDVLMSKSMNRYYILGKHLEEIDTKFDVQVFGSCHAYTSFNPNRLKEETGLSSFVMANPGEIMPSTYLRMLEQFKDYTPKVAIVETWGINPYETYEITEEVLGKFFQPNIQNIPFSLEKLKVIRDFETLSMLEMNFPISQYKDRIMDNDIKGYDFNYSFDAAKEDASEYVRTEMISRLANYGFKVNPSTKLNQYEKLQNSVEDDDILEIESDISKYVYKIIDLCKEYDVELIFYRSPYVSKVNELRKINYFKQICQENDVLFLDLEQGIDYDYSTDFYDYEHLSVTGANKATEYLIPYILQAIDK